MINSLLVVCTGNICRSPMAEAVFAACARAAKKPSFEVASAGTAAMIRQPPPEDAIALMAERGLDISAHRGRQVTEPLTHRCDLILVMETRQQQYLENWWPDLKGRIHRLRERQGEDVIDPYQRPREVFVESLEQIEAGVEDWIGLILS